MTNNYDYIVLGAGIIGLTIARALLQTSPKSKILIIEKEKESGCHGSGRNSGVLHSGIYYPAGSLKAIVCAKGSQAMALYCEEKGLPINRMGKVIVPTVEQNDPQIDLLFQRAHENGANVAIIDKQQLANIEPEARTASGRALHSPDTAVVDPKLILRTMIDELSQQGVQFQYSTQLQSVDVPNSILQTDKGKLGYAELYNATGQHADKVAKMFGAAAGYTSLPFKGVYYKLAEQSNIRLNGLIYPVPDLNMPFLGVHSVTTIDGSQYFGPTALPAFGRENYEGLQGISIAETGNISYNLLVQYIKNKQSFRQFAHEEAFRFIKRNFTQAVQQLVPAVKQAHLLPSNKVGIRAQLLNKKTRELEMDFLVERKHNTVHILNAVSPAFTSSLKFAELVVNNDI